MSDTPTSTLVCPKCQGAMRSYERTGVTIDQCQECRGIFLDRGELDRLIDAEEQRNAAPPGADQPSGRDDRSHQRSHDDDDDDDERRGTKFGGKRRRGGFLSDLFDS